MTKYAVMRNNSSLRTTRHDTAEEAATEIQYINDSPSPIFEEFKPYTVVKIETKEVITKMKQVTTWVEDEQ